jgi:hypothetical protein
MRWSGADVLDFHLLGVRKVGPVPREWRAQNRIRFDCISSSFPVQPSSLLRRLASKRPSVSKLPLHAFSDHFDAGIRQVALAKHFFRRLTSMLFRMVETVDDRSSFERF